MLALHVKAMMEKAKRCVEVAPVVCSSSKCLLLEIGGQFVMLLGVFIVRALLSEVYITALIFGNSQISHLLLRVWRVFGLPWSWLGLGQAGTRLVPILSQVWALPRAPNISSCYSIV